MIYVRILHVIHRFPPYYMAGSEIYTYHLTKELAKYADIFVFTRIENPFENSYLAFDENEGDIRIRRINKPRRDYSLNDKYLDEKIDKAFVQFVKEIKPDLLHVGHLSHLSTNIINIAKEEFNIPIIFTIHDFWLYCLRGQLLDPSLNICSQINEKHCFNCLKSYYKSIDFKDFQEYKHHMDHVIKNIDLFLSPSLFLKQFFEKNGVPHTKIHYSPYGFKKEAIEYQNKQYTPTSEIKFGFTGRIIPAKGIDLLLKAFSKLNYNAKLLVFGELNSLVKYLKWYGNSKVIFRGAYDNGMINEVLQQIDILVVPSIWYENSPLVIQEAFLAGIPVITSNIGGMAELVQDGKNGLTFKVGDVDDLRAKMELLLENPTRLNLIKPLRENVRSIQDDAQNILSLYKELLKK